MHYREYSNHILVCDYCEERESFDDFHEMTDHKRIVGWKSAMNTDGDWLDVCPECLKKEKDWELE